MQPFLTQGDYTNSRYLATADSYDVRPYENYAASDHDFSYGSMNLNLVYRWEYRPGSTLFLVWTHSKIRDENRADNGQDGNWDNQFAAAFPFETEPGNTVMAKFSYWFSI